MVHKIVFIRHGESEWNKLNVFTGWVDVDLSELGVIQALRAGDILKAHGYRFDLAYTSRLKRANRTLAHVLDEMDQGYLTDVKHWRLNERHYGALQGLNKQETADKYGEEQVHKWRRGYAIRPPPLKDDDVRHPRFDPRYYLDVAEEGDQLYLPATESLEDTVARTLPFWQGKIVPSIQAGRRVIVVAHGNSLRGIVKHLDNISDEDIMGVEIPVGTPLVYELDESSLQPVRHYYLGEHQVISSAANAGAQQLAQPTSWGLLSAAGPLLGQWLADLRKVGLTKPLGIMQWTEASAVPPPAAGKAAAAAANASVVTEVGSTVPEAPTSDEADGEAHITPRGTGAGLASPAKYSGVASPAAAAATIEGAVAIEDVAGVLQHSRFVALDLSTLNAMPPSLLLSHVAPKLDPAQHTLLLVTQGQGHPADEAAPAPDLLAPVKEALSSLSLGESLKVLAVQLMPPTPPSVKVALEAARNAPADLGGEEAPEPTLGQGQAGTAAGTTTQPDHAGDTASSAEPGTGTVPPGTATPAAPATAAADVSPLAAPQQDTAAAAASKAVPPPAVPPPAACRVAPLSKAVQQRDVEQLVLMLQYTGRPTEVAQV